MFAGAVVSVFAQFDPATSGSYQCSRRKSNVQNSPFLPSQPNTVGPHAYDVLKYTINLDIYHCYLSPFPHDFKANVRIQFQADSTITNIALNASGSSLHIDSVKLNAASYTHTGNILTISLDRTYYPGETAEIQIYYRHNNVIDGAFYASGGFVFTDCEPEGARHWFPCYDSPSDKALLDLTVKVPANVKLGSNGRLADSVKTADTIVYHWVSTKKLATYLVVMTSKVNYKLDIVYYHKVTNPADSIPMRFYYNSGELPYSCESIIDSMATYYSRNWCEHPFEKNGFATLNNEFYWGGMENQTLTSFCPGCWDVGLMSHEFAHQWFGDMITCDTWADIWLNEGFASWSEAYWYESSGGYTAYLQAIQSFASSYLQGNPGWAISVPAWAVNTPSLGVLFNWEITYCKGACALHQLRYVIGDSLFFKIMKTYCADTNYKYKSATVANFNEVVNSVTGQNYDWFFNEWIFSPNHPVYVNSYQFISLQGGNWEVDFNTKQVQTNAPFFIMPLKLKVHFTDNSDTVVKVMNFYNNQLFKLFFNRQPQSFYFDPANEIVLKQSSTIVGIPETPDTPEVILGQNSPNPASSITTISFVLPAAAEAQISITNTLGEVIWQSDKVVYPKGTHSVEANLSSLPSGVYIYALTTQGRSYIKKMVIYR